MDWLVGCRFFLWYRLMKFDGTKPLFIFFLSAGTGKSVSMSPLLQEISSACRLQAYTYYTYISYCIHSYYHHPPWLDFCNKNGMRVLFHSFHVGFFITFYRGTDMKFRLGFLKRRHTEGTIHSASVRPPPEEAQKWANSFNDLMASKYGQALFKAFLQREFSEENIEFWLAIEDYRKSRQNKLNTKAQKIYNDFIIPQAPKEVNLDSLTKDSLVTKMAQPTHTTFDQAQKRIQGLLEADAYSRFLKSELYMELLHPERYQQSSP
ncbi:Regulator of G-protein signaling 4 [Orchesella cincta]|uniref:Regulator of G-protein signaling 4 n=1 Tax=Orchesella cincta TaxID=48709 RepID=A0A1D2NMI7_ORCCI|nr:Regulator of G-protein signaling 4 [Orchesella cincta]